MTDPRVTLARVASLLTGHFGVRLRGLYLFGSLAAGGFHPGKSDLDLLAVIDSDVEDGDELRALDALHAGFVAEHPEWRERVEVGYVSHTVLRTLGGTPSGRIAVISPGEPLNRKDIEADWVLNWHSVLTSGETIVGPPPREPGPRSPPKHSGEPSSVSSTGGRTTYVSPGSRMSLRVRDTSS